MNSKRILLSQVANIEIYNLKNICPFFLFEKSNREYKKLKSVGVFDRHNEMNIEGKTIKMKDVYFRSGNYAYIALQPYLVQKYTIDLDMGEHEKDTKNQ